MSNLSVCATRTPYHVSGTSYSSSTTVANSSSTTLAVQNASEALRGTTGAYASTANRENVGTLSSSTTASYGNSASNSISIMEGTSSSSTSVPIGTLERNGGQITIYDSTSTVPNITSSSTTPQASSSGDALPPGTLERNGGYITILTSSSTTPSVSSSDVLSKTEEPKTELPYGAIERNGSYIVILNSSSTTPQTTTVPLDKVGGNVSTNPYRPEAVVESNILDKKEFDLYGETDVNSLDKYSEEDFTELMNSLKDQYLELMKTFFDEAEKVGIETSASIHIPIAKYSVPNASVELYCELGAGTTSDIPLASIEASIEDFTEEVMDVENILNMFGVSYGNYVLFEMSGNSDIYFGFKYNDMDINLNVSSMISQTLEITIEKEYEDGGNNKFTMGMELKIDWDSDLYHCAQEVANEVVGEIIKKEVYENQPGYTAKEIQEILEETFIDSFINSINDPSCGYSSLDEAERKMEIARLKDKLIENIKNSEEN